MRVLTKDIPAILCIDVGASYYPHTPFMPMLKSPNTTWVAVEPNFTNINYTKNWEFAAKVAVCQQGLSREGGEKILYLTNTDSGSSLYPPEIHSSFAHRGLDLSYFFPCKEVSITTTTLSALIKEHGINLPIILKLDTQGSELDILHGGAEFLFKNQIIGIELESPMIAHPVMRGSKKFWEVFRDLESFGYELLEIKPIESGSISSNLKYGKRPAWECDSVFCLQRDRAMTLSLEIKVSQVIFYLAYEFFEEAYTFVRDDGETREYFKNRIKQDPLPLFGNLAGL